MNDCDIAHALHWLRVQPHTVHNAVIEEALVAYDPSKVGARTAHKTERLTLSIDVSAQLKEDRIREILIRLGWTPPGDQSWISDEAVGRAAKIIADHVGHGMREKCEGVARDALQSALRSPSGEAEGFYIATFKHGVRGYVLWWAPNNAGYTTDIAAAGIYAAPTPGYHDSETCVPVPVAFARSARMRQMIDIGDTGNEAFWNAPALRAAIASADGGAP